MRIVTLLANHGLRPTLDQEVGAHIAESRIGDFGRIVVAVSTGLHGIACAQSRKYAISIAKGTAYVALITVVAVKTQLTGFPDGNLSMTGCGKGGLVGCGHSANNRERAGMATLAAHRPGTPNSRDIGRSNLSVAAGGTG